MLLRRAAARSAARSLPFRRWFLGVPARREFCIEEVVECSPEQLFAVVAGVDRYAEFIPFCTQSAVLKRRSATSFDAQLSLGFLGFAESYTSRVTLRPVSAVDAEAADSRLFSMMMTQWRLAEGPRPGTCQFDFKLQLQLRSLVHDRALGRVLDTIATQQVQAFKARCATIYRPLQYGRDKRGASASAGAVALGGAASAVVRTRGAAAPPAAASSPVADAADSPAPERTHELVSEAGAGEGCGMQVEGAASGERGDSQHGARETARKRVASQAAGGTGRWAAINGSSKAQAGRARGAAGRQRGAAAAALEGFREGALQIDPAWRQRVEAAFDTRQES